MASKQRACRRFSISGKSSSLQKKQRCESLRTYSGRSSSEVATTSRGIACSSAKGDCIGELGARQAGRIGDDGQHFVSQHLMSSPSQVGGIDAAGVGDEAYALAL